jgi:hypothetical protein
LTIKINEIGKSKITLKKGAKENIWTTYYGRQTISIKTSERGHGAFFKQHLESNIVFLDTFDGAERIELHKGGNTKPKRYEGILSTREKSSLDSYPLLAHTHRTQQRWH